MGMGVVSDKDFANELGNCQVQKREEPFKPKGMVIESPPKGRGGENNVEVPNGLRKLIGDESIINGRSSAIELAANLGISPSSVSAYQQGATSTASYDNRPNLLDINRTKEKVSKRARNKLMLALHHITEDKLESAKVAELAVVARSMSAIVKEMEPEREDPLKGKDGPTFIFYSPQFRKEEHFDIVQAKE